MGSNSNDQSDGRDGGGVSSITQDGPTNRSVEVKSGERDEQLQYRQDTQDNYVQKIKTQEAEISRLKQEYERKHQEAAYYQREMMRENESRAAPHLLDKIYYDACAKVFGNEFPHSMRMNKEAFAKAMRMAQTYKPW